ncbi:MAG: ABC transporter permease subunit [Chloroflexota bacterium]
MTRFIVRRLLWMILVLFVVSLVTFSLMNVIPGGPFDSAGERALPEAIVRNIEEAYGLNNPIWFRYVSYIGGVSVPKLTYGEWQYSFTLDREDAGMEPQLDENGDPVQLAVPRRALTPFRSESVVDNYLLNFRLPFITRGVPVNVRDSASGGGEVVGQLETGAEVDVLRINSRETYYQVQLDSELDNGETIGWVLVDRVNVSSATFDEQNPAAAVTVGAPASFRWFNFGPSYASRSQSVNDYFRNQLIVSAQLGIAAMVIAIAIGIPLGIAAALNRNTIWDYVSMSVAILGVSVPVIVLGPILQYVAVEVAWLPVSGWGTWQQAMLPAFALGFAQSALLARLTRASLLQVLNEDYIRTARAKGLMDRAVILIHALKNAIIPVVTVVGPLFAALVTGSFVTEQIFAIPGIGSYFIISVTNRDYPMIMGTILLYAFFLVIANMLVDVAYALLDPRIRYD